MACGVARSPAGQNEKKRPKVAARIGWLRQFGGACVERGWFLSKDMSQLHHLAFFFFLMCFFVERLAVLWMFLIIS